MRILRFETFEDWLAARSTVITGKKAKGSYPKKRGADKTPTTLWEHLAEMIAEMPDGEKDNERGSRLEPAAIDILSSQIGKEIDTSKCIWLSDISEHIGVSPDGFEPSENPTFAVEVKCLKTSTHLKFVIKSLRADKTASDYNPINYVPNEEQHFFREQVIQNFVTNKHLQKLYFVFYDDRIDPKYSKLAFHVIEIHREHIQDLIEEQTGVELSILSVVKDLMEEFADK